MKSVLPITTFVTAMPAEGYKGLTRGQAILVNSNGDPITAAADLETAAKAGLAIKFVVGLGGGDVKDGVWLNPASIYAKKEAYVAPTNTTITIDMNSLTDAMVTEQDYAGINITLPPKYSFDDNAPKVQRSATTINPRVDTAITVRARILKDLENLVENINRYYGRTVLNFTSAGNIITLSGEIGSVLGVTVDGVLIADMVTKDATSLPIGKGMGWKIAEEEKLTAVGSMGYDPNWQSNHPSVTAKAFLADESVNYTQLVISSQGWPNHPFYPFTTMVYTQFIACATPATIDTIGAIFGAI